MSGIPGLLGLIRHHRREGGVDLDPRLLIVFVVFAVVWVGGGAWLIGGVGPGIFGAALALIGAGGTALLIRPRKRSGGD